MWVLCAVGRCVFFTVIYQQRQVAIFIDREDLKRDSVMKSVRNNINARVLITIAVICGMMLFSLALAGGNNSSAQSGSSEVEQSSVNIKPASRTVKMRVTAYCTCPKCCGQYSDGYTANGHRVRQGDRFVAADPKYHFGTEMVVPGYNNGQTVEVLDRGGVIKGDRLDVFFNCHQEALEWGVQYLDVEILK